MIDLLGRVVAPASVLAGLLFYFGWTFTQARTMYFGIDASVLEFSTRDYVLRSVKPLFVALATALPITAVLLQAHVALERWLLQNRHPALVRTAMLAGMSLGALFFLIGIAGVILPGPFSDHRLVAPLALAIGTCVGADALHLYQTRSSTAHTTGTPPIDTRRFGRAYFAIIASLVVLSLFWTTGEWAQISGWDEGQRLGQHLQSLSSAIVYSTDDLHIPATSGVTVHRFSEFDSSFAFRYGGLKLLVKSAGRYLLIPEGWTRDNGTAVIVLPEGPALRLEFIP